MPGAADNAGEAIENLWLEVRDLSLGITTTHVDHLPSPPTPLQFLREYVSPNKPCLFSNATRHWPALSLWSSTSYLLNKLSSSSVSLHLTPTGRADSLAARPNPTSPSSSSLCFASAHVEKVPFSTALSMVSSCGDMGSKVIAYLQEQNDCYRNEYSALSQDCDQHIPWASEALGCLPEAVNLWIGNDKSVTSFHKDHYENIYAVITGEKHFLLLPPTDVHRMYIREYPAAQYHYSKDYVHKHASRLWEDIEDFRLEIEEPVRYVPWSSVNPYPSPEEKEREIAQFPLYFNGPKPFEVTVRAGQLLYLPSMWFHHVSQSPDRRGLTIAVNYWYDMRFDIKYAYFNFLQSIHYMSPKDLAIHGSLVKSRFNGSTSMRDVSDIRESVEDGDTISQSNCSEEE